MQRSCTTALSHRRGRREQHLTRPAGTVVAVAGVVVATALAGGVFCWLRLRTGSVVTPMLLHWATNGLGYLAARLVL